MTSSCKNLYGALSDSFCLENNSPTLNLARSASPLEGDSWSRIPGFLWFGFVKLGSLYVALTSLELNM